MKLFFDYLQKFGNLSEADKSLIQRNCSIVELKSGEFYMKSGMIYNQVAFVLEGVVRVCSYDKQANEITHYFMKEEKFVLDLASFHERQPAQEYVQVVVDAKMVVWSRSAMQLFQEKIDNWNFIIQRITEKALLEKLAMRSGMITEDAATRYQKFMQEHPDLLQRVPLGYIASYLGITQSSLSRIRKNLK